MEQYINIIKKDKEVNEFASKLSKDEVEMNICLLLEQVKLVNVCFTRACSPSWRLPVQSSRNSLFPINRKQP